MLIALGKFRGPPVVDADWHAFCQAIYKGIGGIEWKELHHHYRDVSKAAGARKPSESHEAKALWPMKAAKDRGDEFYGSDRGDEFYGSARKEDILGRKQTRLELWEEHLKDPIVALDKALKCVEKQYQG